MNRFLTTLAIGLTVLSCAPKGENKTDNITPSEYSTSNMDGMKTVQEFLHSTHVYFLATEDGDQPQVRPFGTAEIIEGKLYIQTGHVKNVAKQIASNPKVARPSAPSTVSSRSASRPLSWKTRVWRSRRPCWMPIRGFGACMTRMMTILPCISSPKQRPASTRSLPRPLR